MKKITRMTALLLAAAICLTSCSGANKTNDSSQYENDTKNEKILQGTDTETSNNSTGVQNSVATHSEGSYISADITDVTEQPYTMYGKSGVYTGNWRYDRPEGNGKFIINDEEYFEGEWTNGMMNGSAKMSIYDEEGTYKFYQGICSYNTPSGNGALITAEADSSYFTVLKGDFSSTFFTYFIYDSDVLRLLDIGIYDNGEMTTFLNNPDLTSYSAGLFVDPSLKVRRQYNEEINYLYCGNYYGELDENGYPHGYGYFDAFGIYKGEENADGIYKAGEKYDYTYAKEGYYTRDLDYFGKWEHGKRIGTYLAIYTDGTGNTDWSQNAYGQLDENGNPTGDFMFIDKNKKFQERMMMYKDTDLIVDTINVETFNYDYQLCDDGLYRGTDETWEVYFKDGNYGIYKLRYYKESLESDKYFSEGEWYLYNEENELIDYGLYVPGSGWDSYETIEEREREKSRQRLSNWAAIGVAAVTAYALYKVAAADSWEDSAAYKYVQENRTRCQQETQKFLDDKEESERLMNEARLQYDIGNTYEAQRLYDQAQEIKPSLLG